jgi:ribosomal protein S18 acetylase RimI-like enzyme
MKISLLEWDSDFFDRPVAKIDIDENELVDMEQAIADCTKQQYKLVYIFVDARNAIMKAKLTAISGPAINEKLILEKKYVEQELVPVVANEACTIVNANALTGGQDFRDKIFDLTLKAGSFSRFKLDRELGEQYFVEMYRIWTDAMVNDPHYRIIIAKTNKEDIAGFLSYKITAAGYKIDFVSIDETCKKMGIGKALLHKMFAEIYDGQLTHIVTEIHAANTAALNFFTSNGFTVKEAFEIYHVHL